MAPAGGLITLTFISIVFFIGVWVGKISNKINVLGGIFRFCFVRLY